jgi:apolipoprotein N-acyltransferase
MIFLTILLSGAAYYLSSYFHEIWWLAWLAPIPVLVYAFKNKLLPTLIVAAIVGCAPGLNQLIGYSSTLLPLSSSILSMLLGSFEFTVITLLTRWLTCRYKLFIVFPILIVIKEFIESYTIQGAFNTLAYSQLKFLPSLQIGSVFGYFAISFILSTFAAAIAFYICFRQSHSKIAVSSLIIGLAIPIVALGSGYYRLDHEDNNNTIKVGLISIPTAPKNIYKAHLATQLAHAYIPLINQLSHKGAKVVMTPEEIFLSTPKTDHQLQKIFASAAKLNHIFLIVGVHQSLAHHVYNTAWLFNPRGELQGKYHKRHFVPGFEDNMTPGKKLLTFKIKDDTFGIAICRDMDYRYPSKAYGKLGINMLFVPAWDFNVDAWVHANGALMRGITNHYTIVRDARGGYLSVSSKTGRTIAIKSDINKISTLLVNAPLAHSTKL